MVQRLLSPPHRTAPLDGTPTPDGAASPGRTASPNRTLPPDGTASQGRTASPDRTVSESAVRTLTRLAEEEWAAYREHPWLVPVLASSRPPLVPAVLEAARTSTEVFMDLGLDAPSALGRYIALSGYVQGMALLLVAERDESMHSGSDYRLWWAQEARRLDRTGLRRRHPWLEAASAGGLPETFDADVDAWFRDGLGRVLVGLVATGGEDS
ncbi:TetR/AcrR family transcriptional regulator C-terminal domain-containing protein [Promicromonospora xylanilytica]